MAKLHNRYLLCYSTVTHASGIFPQFGAEFGFSRTTWTVVRRSKRVRGAARLEVDLCGLGMRRLTRWIPWLRRRCVPGRATVNVHEATVRVVCFALTAVVAVVGIYRRWPSGRL